ncbi:MAG: hypothetical protein E6K70_24420, partial [Planctomycetota bacterium]
MLRRVSRLSWLRPGSPGKPKSRRSSGIVLEALEDRLTPSGSTVRFAVFGDYGVAQQPEQDVANLVHSWNPDFITTTGDNNYSTPPLTTALYDTTVGQYYHDFINPYSGAYGAGATTNRFFPSMGEHDWGALGNNPTGDQGYLNFLQLFILDTDPNEPDGWDRISTQAQWLQGALASSTAPWKVVVMSFPPYSSGLEGSTGDLQLPFQAWGASAVVSGHDHFYERLIEDNNFPYFVVGTGGAGLEAPPASLIAGSKAQASAWGALKVDASPSQMTFSFVSTAGTVLDTYTMNYPLPAAPSKLAVAAVSGTQINLKWTDNSTNETGYTIQRSTDGTNFTTIATAGPATNKYMDSGLNSGTAYYYRVSAYNAGGTSAYSNTASATIPSSMLPSIGAPTKLKTTVASASQVNLAWTDNSAGLYNFQVLRSTDGSNYTAVANLGMGATSYADKGLAPATYFYQVVSTTALGVNMGSTDVAGAVLAPAAPGNLTATNFFSHQINLSWTNNASNATGFNILESTDGVNFTSVGTVGVYATSFTRWFLQPSTTYSYRISAVNASGAASSATASATTSPPTPPLAASNATATALDAHHIKVTWTDNSNPPNVEEDAFALYRSSDGINFVWKQAPARDVTSYTDPDTLTPGTMYYYEIAAFNVDGFAPVSNIASATTLPLPAAPSNLTATALSGTQVSLSWTDNSVSPSAATSFKIYRSTDQVSWAWFASTGQGVTSYTWSGGSPATTYYFYVTASN